jgi:hypothetical protein
MYWAFNKRLSASLYLLAALSLSGPAFAETGVVNAVGYGKESPEAINSLLRSVVTKYFKEDPEALTKAVLQNEILPNASSFVQSYKILEGGRGASVSLSANVDLDIIRALLSLTPAGLGETGPVKAFVVAKGARLPDGAQVAKAGATAIDPYSVLDTAARERLARRQFDVVRLTPEEYTALGQGDDVASFELLRGLGARAGARVALGISSKYETYENENSHNKEQRIVLTATLVDVKTGALLGKSSANVTEPKGRRDQYAADLQRTLAEEGKDLFHEAFVSAGKKLNKSSGQEEFSVVRVEKPGNAQLLGKFRVLLESIKGVKSVVEYSAARGFFDFALRPAQKDGALGKALKALAPEDLTIAVLDAPTPMEDGGKAPAVSVNLTAKEIAPVAVEEVQSANP